MNINSSHGANAHVPAGPAQRTRQRNNRRDGLTDFADDSYLEALRETDTDDESSASLTSQTLNADGTPKRPMNAFMIFARRRRPQVSAANQTMRTGDISKILSKEWNAMHSVEKQFYQDQAKHLKDTFNTRYPDYVYRRRPNNSRRKRKPDGGGARQDKMVSLDTGDDVLGLVDLGESFTDAEDSHEDPPDPLELRQSGYSDPRKFALSQTRSFSYAYPGMNHSHRSNGTQEGTPLYGQNTFGVPPCPPQSNSVGPPHAHSQLDSHRSHSYSEPLFASQPQYTHSHESYETSAMRPIPWPQGAGHDRPGAQKHHFSTSANNFTGPETTMVSSRPAPNAAFSSGYVLPTLNSPFYPSPGQISNQSSVSYSTGSPHPQSPFSTGIVLQTSSPETEHENYAYSSASSCSPASVASGQGAPPPYSRHNTSPYSSHFHPSSHYSLPNSGLSTPQAYWSGE